MADSAENARGRRDAVLDGEAFRDVVEPGAWRREHGARLDAALSRISCNCAAFPGGSAMTGALLVLLYFGMALVGAIIVLQPDRFVVMRSRTIAARPSALFDLVNDLHRWRSWSPWAELDPNAQNHFEGPSSGEGAVMAWSGDKRVGAGRMTIVASTPDESVDIKLEMQKPVVAQNDVYFRIAPEGDGARIEWTMSGRRGLLAKAMNLVMRFDDMIGAQFEKGLANLDAVATKAEA